MDKPWLKFYEPKVPSTFAYPDEPLFHFLDNAVAKFPNRPATYFFDERISYRTLGSYVNRFANALIALGVKKGDRVAIHLPNSPQFVIAYYGALKAGAVVAAHSLLYTETELEHQLNDCGAETIVTLTLTYDRVKAAQPKTKVRNVIVSNIKDFFPPHLKLLFTLFREQKEGHRADVQAGDPMLERLLLRFPDSAPQVDVSADDLALLQYTGGTTGLPKAAMLTHRVLVTNTIQAALWNTTAVEGKETTLCVLPFFHLYGQQLGMNQSIYFASSMILIPRYERKPVLRAIDKRHPTIFPGVATLYINLMEDPTLSKHDLRSIKVCLSGAMALPQEVQEKFERISGGHLVEGYGMTETGPVTHANPIRGARKIGSIGVPVSDTDAKILSIEDGETEMPIGETGEICVKGPQIMTGYWNKSSETDSMIRERPSTGSGERWLHTGDIGKMDADGFFYIVDRMKDMIITGGFKIFPRDVEEVLYAHPKIKEAALVGIKDPYHGELPKAFIVLHDGETATPDEIIAHCKQQLASYKIPKQVEFRTELPKSLVGKILKRKLVEE
ncbi:MAG: long-chain fatty acid--CoA ligase [Chloroflexota bacterium]